MLKKKNKSFFLFAISVIGVMIFGGTHAVYAQANSSVNVEVCDANGPTITVTSPQNGGVVTKPQIQLAGTAYFTTQIDITVNGGYAQSLAIDSNNAFVVPLTLELGTSTLELRGYYTCNQRSVTSKVVITYDPNAATASGTTTTNTPPTTQTASQSNSDSNNTQALPDRVRENLGFVEPIEDQVLYETYVVRVRSWQALFLATLFAGMIFILPHHLQQLIAAAGYSPKAGKRKQVMFRCVAAVLFIIFVYILQM